MLDMGFKPAVDRIVAQCPEQRQTLFFSATLDGEAGRIAQAFTSDAVPPRAHPAGRSRSRDIEHRFVAVERDERIRRADRRAARRTATSRSSSCAPSAAPTASSSA